MDRSTSLTGRQGRVDKVDRVDKSTRSTGLTALTWSTIILPIKSICLASSWVADRERRYWLSVVLKPPFAIVTTSVRGPHKEAVSPSRLASTMVFEQFVAFSYKSIHWKNSASSTCCSGILVFTPFCKH